MKRKVWLFSNCILAFVAVLLLIRVCLPLKSYSFQGEKTIGNGESTVTAALYEQISLKPGVYRIVLEYTSEKDNQGYCSLENAAGPTRALLANYDNFYSAKNHTDFTVWLLKAKDSLVVNATISGGNILTAGDLTIYETRGLWTMLLAFWICVWAVWDLGLKIYEKNQKREISRESMKNFLWILLITLLASMPFLKDGILLRGDMVYHLHRLEAVQAGLEAGQFPVRIAPKWLYGQGYADPVFYCNVTLIVYGLLRMIGLPMTLSFQLFAILINAATAVVSLYAFRRIFQSEKAGRICCAFYTLSLFRIFRFVVCGSVGEGSALIFLPLILLGFYETLGKKRGEAPDPKAWFHLALGFAGTVQTHVLTTEITVLVTVVFCLVFIRKVLQKEIFLMLCKGALGAVLLSLWFLVPFLDYYLTQDVHIKHVSERTIQMMGLLPRELFGWFVKTPVIDGQFDVINNRWPAYLHGLLVIALILYLVMWIVKRLKKEKTDSFITLSACLGAVLAIFTLRKFPWDGIQNLSFVPDALISSLQFPYRFLGWAGCLLVLVAGYLTVSAENKETGSERPVAKMLAKWAPLAVTLLFLTSIYYQLDSMNKTFTFVKVYNEEAIGFGYISGAEYIIEGTDYLSLTFEEPAAGPGVTYEEYENELLHITAHCVNAGEQDSYIDLPLLLYKGYRAIDKGTGQKLSITYDPEKQIRVLLPAGYNGTLEVRFVSPLYWRLAELITGLYLLFLLWKIIRRRIHR